MSHTQSVQPPQGRKGDNMLAWSTMINGLDVGVWLWTWLVPKQITTQSGEREEKKTHQQDHNFWRTRGELANIGCHWETERTKKKVNQLQWKLHEGEGEKQMDFGGFQPDNNINSVNKSWALLEARFNGGWPSWSAVGIVFIGFQSVTPSKKCLFFSK